MWVCVLVGGVWFSMSLAAFQTVEACAEVAAASSQSAVGSWWTVSSFAWISGVWVVCVCVCVCFSFCLMLLPHPRMSVLASRGFVGACGTAGM